MRGRWLFALAFGLWGAAFGRDTFEAWVDQTELPKLQLQTSVEVVDRKGLLLRAYTVADGRWRLDVAKEEVDPRYIDMLLNYEDRRFYQHSGVDTWAMGRALGQAIWNGRVLSGGSTLTMQVARLLEEGSTGKLGGKFRQMRLALKLERVLTKAQILELYLLLAPFGGNLEGVRAASLSYFGKEPRRLTPAEAALLVAIPQSPESRRPDRGVDRAFTARSRVLARAVRYDLISAEEAEAALREAVPRQRHSFPALSAHLADRAKAEAPSLEIHHLTLDRSLQLGLESLARGALQDRENALQIAILVADHRTGEILASVGSAAFTADARQGFVDMTQALRSPGSTLKPLVYAMAFDAGLAHPETFLSDRPQVFGTYAPQNFDRIFRGDVRAREALQLSLNLPVVALAEAIGPHKILGSLRKTGVRYQLPGETIGLAITLGGIGVSLQDLVQLYASLADGGAVRRLYHRMDQPKSDEAQLVSQVAAWQVSDILAGLAAPPGAPSNRLAYKTGTSYGHRDAWAIGYDGAHVVGVWMGRADGTPVPGAFGADLAAPVLFQSFQRIKPDLIPQRAAPAPTLLLSNAQLPPPLQRFRPREAAFMPQNAPKFTFPPDGSELELLGQDFKVKVSGGKPPFTWLIDDRPVLIAERRREAMLTAPSRGFVQLSVIDADGKSAQSRVFLH